MKVLLHGLYEDSTAYTDYVSRGFEENVGSRNVGYMVPNIFTRDNFNPNASKKLVGMDDIDKFDLIVFSYYSLFDNKLLDILNSNTSATKIYIDQEDNFFIKSIANHKEIKYYFKRELYKKLYPKLALEWTLRYLYGNYYVTYKGNRHLLKLKYFLNPLFQPCGYAVDGRNSKVKPFPLAYTSDLKKPPKIRKTREYDLTVVAKPQNIAERHRVYNYALKLKSEFPTYNMIVSKGGYSKADYLKILSNSKSSISVRGLGYDTYRYWEIAYSGATLISQELPLLIPNNFIDGESALFFKDETELKEKFQKYVINSDEWIAIAANAQKNYLKYHTPKERVKNQILRYLA